MGYLSSSISFNCWFGIILNQRQIKTTGTKTPYLDLIAGSILNKPRAIPGPLGNDLAARIAYHDRQTFPRQFEPDLLKTRQKAHFAFLREI